MKVYTQHAPSDAEENFIRTEEKFQKLRLPPFPSFVRPIGVASFLSDSPNSTPFARDLTYPLRAGRLSELSANGNSRFVPP